MFEGRKALCRRAFCGKVAALASLHAGPNYSIVAREQRSRDTPPMHRLYLYLGFMIAISGVCAAGSSECVPPAALQAKLQAQPKADTYADAGMWYAGHRKYACAVEAYRSALQQEPKSAELMYLLGLTLIRKGGASG